VLRSLRVGSAWIVIIYIMMRIQLRNVVVVNILKNMSVMNVERVMNLSMRQENVVLLRSASFGNVRSAMIDMKIKRRRRNVVVIQMTYDASQVGVDPNDSCGDGMECSNCGSRDVNSSKDSGSSYWFSICNSCDRISMKINSRSRTEKEVDPNG